MVRSSGDVGIWHETFKIRAGEYEAVYGNMVVFGVAAVARPCPPPRRHARIGANATDEPAVEPC